MQSSLCQIPKISQRFDSEWRSGSWCCDLNENRTAQCPSSNFDSTISRHFLSRHLTFTFPEKLSSDILLYIVCAMCIACDHFSWTLRWSSLSAILLVLCRTSTPAKTLELTKGFLHCSTLSTFRVWFDFHQLLFRISTGLLPLRPYLLWRLPLHRNLSVHVCRHWRPLLGFKYIIRKSEFVLFAKTDFQRYQTSSSSKSPFTCETACFFP